MPLILVAFWMQNSNLSDIQKMRVVMLLRKVLDCGIAFDQLLIYTCVCECSKRSVGTGTDHQENCGFALKRLGKALRK